MTTVARRSFGVADLAEFNAVMDEFSSEVGPPSEAGDYVAFTDGACFGNPNGPGGWAAVMQPPGEGIADLQWDRAPGEGGPWLLWGHLSSTSNNRAEALGVLAALEWVPAGSRLALHSDSELSVRILQGRYKAKANPDIWEVINRTRAEKRLEVSPEWVRGHAGDPRNELADRLSKLGARHAANLDALGGLLLEEEPARAPRAAEPAELAGLDPQGAWEKDFLKSVAKQLKAGRALSPKQTAVVDRIRSRGRPSS